MSEVEGSVNISQLEGILQVYYANPGAQSEVHQYLQQAQYSPEAWRFCWMLLDPNKNAQVQFFGAATLYLKITQFWGELTPDRYEELKTNLTQLILSHVATNGQKIVRTRLEVCLAAFLIRTIQLEVWKSGIRDLIEYFGPGKCTGFTLEQTTALLLDILTIIPDEFQTSILHQFNRGLIRGELIKNSLYVIEFIKNRIFTWQLSKETHLAAFKCLGSWVHLGVPLSDCHTLVPFLVDAAVSSTDYTETALDALTQTICQEDSHKFQLSLKNVMVQLLRLQSILEQGYKENSSDTVFAVYNLLVNFAENNPKIILDSMIETQPSQTEYRKAATKIVELIVQCSASNGYYPEDETHSCLPFNLWYVLQDEIVSAEKDKSASYLVYFTGVYESLLDVFIRKAAYPPEKIYTVWDSEMKEQHANYRQDIWDTMMYSYNILRDNILVHFLNRLRQALEAYSADSKQWMFLESTLYAIHSVSDSVSEEEGTSLPQVFELIQQIQYFGNQRLIATVLSTIGAYSEWIGCHPSVLNKIVPLVLSGINQPDISSFATITLKEICVTCQTALEPFVPAILDECQLVLGNALIDDKEKHRLMCVVGKMVSLQSTSDIENSLSVILAPVLQQMEGVASSETHASHENGAICLFNLNLLGMLCSNLDIRSDSKSNRVDTQPVLYIMQRLLPILEAILNKYSSPAYQSVTSSIWVLLKKATTTLLDDVKPILPTILNLLALAFNSNMDMGVLELSKTLILLFSKHVDFREHLSTLLRLLVAKTLRLFVFSMRENPDFIENFYLMINQILKKNREFILSVLDPASELMPVFDFAVHGLKLPESSSVRACSAFLVGFVSADYPASQVITESRGEMLLCQIFAVIASPDTPRRCMNALKDVILALNKSYFDSLCLWMNACVERTECFSPRLNREQRHHYAKAVLKERTNKRRLQDVITELILVSRGLLDTDYGKQIMVCL